MAQAVRFRQGRCIPHKTIKLRDGSSATLRPIGKDDKDLLVRGFERLSPDSRYRRFFTAMSQLSAAQLTYLTEIDHHDHEAIVAIEPATGEPLGVARYVRSQPEPHVAEVAVVVGDDWQGRGVGSALLEHLADRARDEGIGCFSAVVQGDNVPIMRLLEGLGDAVRWHEGAHAELRIDLPARGIGPQLARLLRASAAGSVVVAGTLLHRTAVAARPFPRTAPRPVRSGAGIQVIIAGTDGSPAAEQAVRVALELSGRLGSRLHLVSAFNPAAPSTLREFREAVPDTLDSLRWVITGREHAEAALRSAVRPAQAAGLEPIVHARPGDPAEAVIEVAVEEGADLIVVGSKGMADRRRFLLGSVADRVAHHAPCSVMIVRTT
jgi:nucleotide-binding universal stress UspA family protein/RimJ/RimL family protein N-acetyltransferase